MAATGCVHPNFASNVVGLESNGRQLAYLVVKMSGESVEKASLSPDGSLSIHSNYDKIGVSYFRIILQANGSRRHVGHTGNFEKTRKGHNDKHGKPRSKSPAKGNGKGGARSHVKGTVAEDNHEDPGNLSDSSASSRGSAHMKAMVPDSQCTNVFGG